METEEKKKVCGGSIALAKINGIVSVGFIVFAIYAILKYNKYGYGIIGLIPLIAALFFGIHGIRYYRQRKMDKYRFSWEEKDGRRVRKSLSQGIAQGIIRLLFWSFFSFGWYNAINYLAVCPKITCESQITVHKGEVFTFDDLATVTSMCDRGQIHTGILIYEIGAGGLSSYVSEDGNTLYIGDKNETFDLRLYARTYEEKTKDITITVE